MRHRWATCVLIAGLAAAPGVHGASQDYPTRPITMIVPFAAGGGSDISTRVIAQKLGDLFGRQVLVENRAGASGVIGWSAGASAAPDGYTILALETSFAMAPGLIPNLPFDPLRDFSHLAITGAVPFVMVVNPTVPARTVAEFVALAKAAPGRMNYSSAGNGTSTHLGAEWFRSLTGVELAHIPYKGGGPAGQAVLANETQMSFPALSSALANIKAGKLRALMVTAAKRNAAAPDIPSAPEAGIPAMVGDNWFSLAVPARTPADIQAKLHATVLTALADPGVKERLAALGFDVVGSSPAQATKQIGDEIQRWTGLIKSARIKAD